MDLFGVVMQRNYTYKPWLDSINKNYNIWQENFSDTNNISWYIRSSMVILKSTSRGFTEISKNIRQGIGTKRGKVLHQPSRENR